jgi:hypothetical protein
VVILVAALTSSLALAACGAGSRQDVAEPSGTFPVQVTSASFPGSQTLSQHAHMQITVKNVGNHAIPDLAVTVCNVTCGYPAPPGQGSSSGAFASNLSENYLANATRPVWVVDRPPGSCSGRTGYSCKGGGAGADASAYANTWTSGRLAPGASVTFDWAVTAVSAGHHVVAWMVAAGLNGKAKAVLNGGGVPQGQFAVQISRKPSQSYVNNAGQIVTTP